jgi:hypothetical protein
MGTLHTLRRGAADTEDVLLSVATLSADGAITAPDQGHKAFLITKGTAAALTLAAPTTAQNGVRISIISTTDAAHTVTNASPGFNGDGASGDVATFGAAAGNALVVVAYGGTWYRESSVGVTFS